MLNRPALRHALRGPYAWFMVAVTAAYLTLAVIAGSPVWTTAAYATCFGAVAAIAFGVRYKLHVDDQARDARNAEREAERAARAAELQDRLDELDRERAAREQERAQRQREDILAGRRCPAWCDSCEEEERESARQTAVFLAERAERHGHPNAQDVEALGSIDRTMESLDRIEAAVDGALAKLKK